MEKLHSLRIVHRDLKLANILVNKDFQVFIIYYIFFFIYKFITPNYFFKKKFYRSS